MRCIIKVYYIVLSRKGFFKIFSLIVRTCVIGINKLVLPALFKLSIFSISGNIPLHSFLHWPTETVDIVKCVCKSLL